MAKQTNKTQLTAASVAEFLARVTPDERRADALALSTMMERVAGEPPRMWGGAIVGFGVRRYRYESGREGEICKVGFSPRKDAFALYVVGEAENNVAALGKVKAGKSCIYVKRLADVDLGRLEALVSETIAAS